MWNEPAPSDDVDPIELLLVADDVPGWSHVSAHEVDSGLSRLTLDCDRMDALNEVLSRPALQVGGTFEGTEFRQRVVDLDDAWESGWLLEVVDGLPTYCARFNDVEGRWSANQSPDPGRWGAGIVFGRSTAKSFVTVWPVGARAVILEMEGPASSDNLSPLVAAVEARLSGSSEPAAAVTAAPVTPETTEPAWVVDESEWSQHPLARWVLDAQQVGPSWRHMFVQETEVLVGETPDQRCAIPVPFEPPGLQMYFEHDTGGELIETVQAGPAGELQALIDTDLALDGCSTSRSSWQSATSTIEHTTPAGADSSSLVYWNYGPINQGELISTVMVGRVRYGTTLVTFSWDGENDPDPVTPVPTPGAMLDLMAAAGR